MVGTMASPFPGNCFTIAATLPTACRPPWRHSWHPPAGASPKDLMPSEGFQGRLAMSATGAKFKVIPNARSSVPIALPT
jgi:hypothetical protein